MESQICTMKKLWQNGKGLRYVTMWHVLVTCIGHALHCCNGALHGLTGQALSFSVIVLFLHQVKIVPPAP
jgi:hypothetical protein